MKRKSYDRSASRVSASFTCLRGTNSVMDEPGSDRSSYLGGGPIENELLPRPQSDRESSGLQGMLHSALSYNSKFMTQTKLKDEKRARS